jgi:hypothetical protein
MSTTVSKATPSPTPTVSPQELGQFLDAVASAPVALRDVPRINSILARLVGLANSTGPIGEIREPSTVYDGVPSAPPANAG